MRTALGTIDLIQVLKGELELGGQTFDPCSKVPFGKRRQLVEKRLNDSRIDKDHQNLEGKPGRWRFSFKATACSNWTGSQKRHQKRNEAVTSPLEDFQKCGKERSTECEPDQPALEGVREEQPRSRLVKPVLFLENKSLICGEWDARNRGDKEQNSSEEKRLSDLMNTGQISNIEHGRKIELTSYSGPYPKVEQTLPAISHDHAYTPQ